MKDLKVNDKLEVTIKKITQGADENIYITVESDLFQNRPTFLLKKDKFVWQSDTGRVTIRN